MSGDPEERSSAADSVPSSEAMDLDADTEARLDRLVDLQSESSFPASDPPSFWAGE